MTEESIKKGKKCIKDGVCEFTNDVNMYSKLKCELMVEKAKNRELERDIKELMDLTGLKGPKCIQDRRKEEQIKILNDVSLERDNRYMNNIEINICLGMIGRNLSDKVNKNAD